MLNLSLNQDLYRKLKAKAEAENTSVAALIVKILREALK